MKKTTLLGLPIYDKPSEDKFKLNDWNTANEKMDKAYERVINIGDNITTVNADAEMIDARKGSKVLGDRIQEFIDYMTRTEKINILKYSMFKVGDDWSPVMDIALEVNGGVGEIIFPFGREYRFSRTIELKDTHKLTIESGARLIATEPMDIFIKRHGTLNNLTREYSFYNTISGGGIIDSNCKAKIGVSLGGYRGFTMEHLFVINAIEKNIVTKGEGVEYAVEFNGHKLNIETENKYTDINSTGILVNSTDNHFSEIYVVDCKNGIEVASNSNRFFRCHVWNRDRIIDKDLGYKGFYVTGESNTFDTCFSDTVNVGIDTVHGNTYINCDFFNSQFFRAKNMVAINIIGTPTKPLIFSYCTAKGDGSTAPITKAIQGTVNNLVHVIECVTGFNVTEGFPTNPSVGAVKFWGTDMDLKGTINAENITVRTNSSLKTVYVSDKVQTPKLELGSLGKKITMSDDYILLANDRPIPVYHNFKPTSSSTPGKVGQWYVSTDGVDIYINETIGWLRIDRSVLKTF